ncbi:IS3 family transposase [Caldovatus aquaticus]|uniref:IS3 family transposase n=1 Tax=Caldovatus aquaticus TaxID=2865671 RepID=A0ABS7F7S9_9PROT|nr:IS3 family transposase [Caldovatus aquaticus]MBW8271519.1 IS3 family transposase [Caldovatus aquaticus]
MSKPVERVEVVTGRERRRRYTAEGKVRLVEETTRPGMTVFAVARLHGVSPSLLFGWRRRMAEGGLEAVGADGKVVSPSRVRELETKVRELERLLGRKTMEAGILREALDQARPQKTELALAVAATGRFAAKAVADTLGVARSNPVAQLRHPERRRRGPYRRVGDDDLLADIRAIADARPTYGYRRVAALPNRARRTSGEPPVNRKRVLRLMRQASLLLQPHTGRRPIRTHEGTAVAPASNRRWASDGFEIPCWNGEMVRVAFAIDAHDREVIARVATVGAGISGEMVRDMMLECVERRFGAVRAPEPVQWLADNGSAYAAAETVDFATAPKLVARFTPVRSPESNGVREAFVKTVKRDYLRANPRPDAISVLQQLPARFEDYNAIHPHSGLRMLSPRELIAQQSATQAVCPV